MALVAATPRVVYTGDDATSAFNVEDGDGNLIYFSANSDISAQTVVAATGASTDLTEGVDYTLTAVSGGGLTPGVLTLSAGALATGTKLTIWRTTDRSQDTTFGLASDFSGTTHTAVADKHRRIDQELQDALGRALKLDRAETYYDAGSKRITGVADATGDTDAVSYGFLQDYSIAAGSATGDVLGAATSVDGEVVLYSGTTGKALKRMTGSGLVRVASGVASVAASGTDYAPITSGTSWLKGNGSGGFSNVNLSASAAVQKGDGSGGLTAAAATDLGAGKHTAWIPAGAMVPRTTNGAAAGATELTTNDVMLSTLDFDTTTEEGAGFWLLMPKSWNESTVTFKPVWTAASGTGGVVWGVAGYAFSNDDALDTAVSGQQTSTDTLLAANDCHIGPESSAITIGGTPTDGDLVYLEITREVGDGSDTLAADAKLIGIHLYITTDALTDD